VSPNHSLPSSLVPLAHYGHASAYSELIGQMPSESFASSRD
jgi:hypothetical protein